MPRSKAKCSTQQQAQPHKRLSSQSSTSVAPASSSAADGAASSCSALDLPPLNWSRPSRQAKAIQRQYAQPHPDWKRLSWRAEDIGRRLDLLLRHDARGARASVTGAISLETAAEMLKSSVGTVEYVVEHSRYRHSGERRFQIQGDGVRATNGPSESWWGAAHAVGGSSDTDECPTGTAASPAPASPWQRK